MINVEKYLQFSWLKPADVKGIKVDHYNFKAKELFIYYVYVKDMQQSIMSHEYDTEEQRNAAMREFIILISKEADGETV